jgi:hypothetical protein
VIDVNPNADISADASVAVAAGKAGYCYGKLGSRVVDFAARRHPQRLCGKGGIGFQPVSSGDRLGAYPAQSDASEPPPPPVAA